MFSKKNCEKALLISSLLKYYFDFSLVNEKNRDAHSFIFLLKKDVSLEVDLMRISFTKIYENLLTVFENYKQRIKSNGEWLLIRRLRQCPTADQSPVQILDQGQREVR